MVGLRNTELYVAILLWTMTSVMLSTTIQYSAMGLVESNGVSAGFFHCNGSANGGCFGRVQEEDEEDLGFELLMESGTSQMVVDETRRQLQQRGRASYLALNPNVVCGRDRFGYLCTPRANKDVKRSEHCRGPSKDYNRACHRQPR